jgi:probable F420-dependent oxidoreductase
MMRVGVTLPQSNWTADPVAIKDYVQAVEQLGYHHIGSLDHVLGANAASRPGWEGYYDHTDLIHEPLVLFGYLAAVTETLELVTSIVILPQRQTALVAKQTAEIDVLSGGRMRLGVAIGWNDVEFEALGENFHDRGRRSEEQIEVLRALWTQELVDFQGRWHKITDAGINPLPVQRPIPIWFGGDAEPVIKRIAQLGDGWFPGFEPDENGRAAIDRLRGYAQEAGRDPSDIGIDGTVTLGGHSEDEWITAATAWRDAGATHLSLDTERADLVFPDGHIDTIRRFMDAAKETGVVDRS